MIFTSYTCVPNTYRLCYRSASNTTKVRCSFPKIPYPPLETGPHSPLYGGNEDRGVSRRFNGWWEFYVRGENPDYPMRRRSFEFLWSRGVDVYKMNINEIEDWTRWVEIRRQYKVRPNPTFHPQFPRGIQLEDKLRHLICRFPRTDAHWKCVREKKKVSKVKS